MTSLCTSSPGLVAACRRRTESLCLNHRVPWWLSGVQLSGPRYAVLDYTDPGSVVCVDREGEVQHTGYSRDTSPGYQSVHRPHYMTTEQCGRLLVADSFNHRIQLVSASGTFLQHVVTGKDDGVWRPGCLCQDADSGLLVVSHRDSGDTDGVGWFTPTVSVFKYQASGCH